MKLTLFAVLFLITATSISAIACMGARIDLNNDTTITGSQLLAPTSNKIYETKDLIGKVFNASGTDKIPTHMIEVLGVTSDSGGVISTVYMIKDLKASSEKVVVLHTNYYGNGVTARDIGNPDSTLIKSTRFDTLYGAGCGGTGK